MTSAKDRQIEILRRKLSEKTTSIRSLQLVDRIDCSTKTQHAPIIEPLFSEILNVLRSPDVMVDQFPVEDTPVE